MNEGQHTEQSAMRFLRYVVPIIAVFAVLLYVILKPEEIQLAEIKTSDDNFQNEVSTDHGLPQSEGFELIQGQCSGCHSLKLVAQNKLTRQGWKDLIVWMQQEQNLWDLGDLEEPILDYLEANCSPKRGGRRKTLPKPEWYALD